MTNPGYDLPDCVGKSLQWCYHILYRDTYRLNRSWLIDWHTKFPFVLVSDDDFPDLLSSRSFLSSLVPSPKNTKLSHRSLSLHAMINS